MLEAWLEFHRATLLTKCAGLTDDQLGTRSAPPSSLSLLGLVRHAAQVERNWFRAAFTDDAEPLFASDLEAFDVETADAATDFARLRAEVEHSRRVAAALSTLDARGTGIRGGERIAPSLRWVYVHMIEEYARHNGHADLLRERIDGVVGV
ncbi:MAG: DinB family protein [Streptosporangiales bacterium]|nr:DinB family protein [Streptosporangiales bacterium]MBO0891736.1 DinB family protein [Acidothermales bacterium]